MDSKFFIKHTYISKKENANGKNLVEEHIKYIGFRAMEAKDKGLFDKENIKIDYKKFTQSVAEDKALQHFQSVKLHKLVLSLREEDYKDYKESGKDYKDITREFMKNLEKKIDTKLEWVANIHEKDNHPHVHIAIKAVGKDNKNNTKRVVFSKNSYKEMKDLFKNIYYREVEYNNNLDKDCSYENKKYLSNTKTIDFSKSSMTAFKQVFKSIFINEQNKTYSEEIRKKENNKQKENERRIER